VDLETPGNGPDDLSKVFSRAGFQLGESFVVYMLDAQTIQSAESLGQDLSQLVSPTDRQHHQLKVDQQPVAFARSDMSENNAVCQLLVSDLAQDVQDAMVWIDEFEDAHLEYSQTLPLVRLLAVPAYNVHAFWVFKTTEYVSDVLVVSAPTWLEKLEKRRLYSTREFLQAFYGKQPITGLGDLEPSE
jgi:hypothetical protein